MSTTGGRNYVPTNDAAFCEWGANVYGYARQHASAWGVVAPDNDMVDRLNSLKAKVAKCRLPTRSKVDTLVKNEARKVVEKELRGYVQGLVVKNPAVSDEDREMMGLPIYDTIPTPVGAPVGLATAMFNYPNEGAIELNIRHVEGTPFDPRASYGVRIQYGIFPFDEPVDDVGRLHQSAFTRRKKKLFTFDRRDSGRKAWFCLRYENGKGQAGQWGTVVSAVIP